MPWKDSPKNPAYNTAAWRKARLACLRAANWRCQIRGPRCQGQAKIADHILGIANDPQHRHLQAACQNCSDAKTHRESGDARRGKSRPSSDPEPRARTRW